MAKHPRDFSSYSGFLTEGLQARLAPDTTADFVLEIADPQVTWRNLAGPHFERSLEVNIIYRDSTDHEYMVSRLDTLHKTEIPQARKTDYRPLRGEDPRFMSKFGAPAAMIAAGIAGIISLFYIRSA